GVKTREGQILRQRRKEFTLVSQRHAVQWITHQELVVGSKEMFIVVRIGRKVAAIAAAPRILKEIQSGGVKVLRIRRRKAGAVVQLPLRCVTFENIPAAWNQWHRFELVAVTLEEPASTGDIGQLHVIEQYVRSGEDDAWFDDK